MRPGRVGLEKPQKRKEVRLGTGGGRLLMSSESPRVDGGTSLGREIYEQAGPAVPFDWTTTEHNSDTAVSYNKEVDRLLMDEK